MTSPEVLRLSHNDNPSKAFFASLETFHRPRMSSWTASVEEGPSYPVWGVFSGREPVRLSQVLEDPEQAQAFETPQDIVIPLPGGSNPLWQNDWENRDCKDAPLLRVFTRRVMQKFGVEFKTRRRETKTLNITFIDRRGTRKLMDQDVLLEAARKEFPLPDFNIQSIRRFPSPTSFE